MPNFTLIDEQYLKNYYIKDSATDIRSLYDYAKRSFSGSLHPHLDVFPSPIYPKIMGLNILSGKLNYSAPLENLVANYKRLKSNVTTFNSTKNPLPIAVRYISENQTYFIERYPFQKTVDLSDHQRRQHISKEENITIWIPWTMSLVSAVHAHNIRILCSHKSLSEPTDTYIGGVFPNSYSRGDICFGQSTHLHPEIFGTYDTLGTADDVKTIYSTLFNEYFDAGWNSDLTANVYQNISAFSHNIKKDAYPMLYRFVYPDQDIIKDKLAHVSKRKTNILQSLTTRSHKPVHQHMYTLMMLATFSLEETLQFYKEYSEILTKYGYEHVMKFSKISSASSSEYDDAIGLVNFSNLLSPPHQANLNLASKITLEDSVLSNAYISYYNSSRRSSGGYEVEFNFNYNREAYIGTDFANYQSLFKDYLDLNHKGFGKDLPIYFVDIKDFSWERIIFKAEDFPKPTNPISYMSFSQDHMYAAYFSAKYYFDKYLSKSTPTVTELV